MLIGGIALGLILGLLAGGVSPTSPRSGCTGVPLLFVAVIVRFGTEFLLDADVPLVGGAARPAPGRPPSRSCSSASGPTAATRA